jgi:glycosyltransferase involved in cell wall biosynthesis
VRRLGYWDAAAGIFPMPPRTLIAIPCFNEEIAVSSVVLLARKHGDEVLVVDDGSEDRTGRLAREAGAVVLTHEKNKGKGGAYLTLWRHAQTGGFDRLVVLDGDGQHDADEVPLLLAKLDEGADVVIGSRWGHTTEMPTWRRVGKRVLDYATAAGSTRGAAGVRLTDSQSGFRAFNKKALEAIEPHSDGFSIESQMLIDAQTTGLRIAETRINCRYEGLDGSTQAPVRHAAGVLNDLLIFMGIRHPLLLIALPGVFTVVASIAVGIYALYLDARGINAPGYFLLCLLLGILGILAIFMGMIFHLMPKVVGRRNA